MIDVAAPAWLMIAIWADGTSLNMYDPRFQTLSLCMDEITSRDWNKETETITGIIRMDDPVFVGCIAGNVSTKPLIDGIVNGRKSHD